MIDLAMTTESTKSICALLFTITFCIAFLGFGGLIIDRTVIGRNYHAPMAQQSLVNAYKNCAGAAGTSSSDCVKVLGISPAPTPSPVVVPVTKQVGK